MDYEGIFKNLIQEVNYWKEQTAIAINQNKELNKRLEQMETKVNYLTVMGSMSPEEDKKNASLELSKIIVDEQSKKVLPGNVLS